MLIRKMAVAGRFYPSAEPELTALFQQWRQRREEIATAIGQPPRALILPHAGYAYSGEAAYKGLQLWRAASDKIHTVVVMGPAHRMAFEGIATLSVDAVETPLGQLRLDIDLRNKLLQGGYQLGVSDVANAQEHSLEVHFPMIKSILPQAKVLPLLNGSVAASEVADLLSTLWSDPHVYFVISSDLSHFHSYEQAQKIDRETAQMIRQFDGRFLDGQRACGYKGIQGLLGLKSRYDLSIEQLQLLNSGDTAGDKQRVVGYGAWSMYEAPL